MAETIGLLLIFMVITSSVCNNAFIQDAREVKTLGQAVTSILQKTVNEFLIVKIITYGKQRNFRDEIDEIMRIAQGQLVFEVIESNMVNSWHIDTPGKICPGICLLMFESMDNYHDAVFFSTSYVVSRDFASNLIIKFIRNVLPQQVLDLAKEHLKWNEIYHVEIPNVFTLVNGNGSFIDLFEVNFFVGDNKNGTCNQLAISIINRFSKEKLEWENELKQLKKRDKFNACVLKYDVSGDEGIYVNRSLRNDINQQPDQKHVYGYLTEIVKEVTTINKFSLMFETSSNDLLDNETFADFFEGVFSESHNPGVFESNAVVYKRRQQLMPLIYKELYFVIPKGELYTEWEKLYLAFDLVTWCLIVATFAAAFGTIIIVSNFATQRVRDFVFGESVSTPSLNVLIAFFGLGQIILPRRNFARFLLMLFIVWSLIFRTCYQGLLFEYLQGDGRKPAIKSIKELLDRNLTYFIHIHHCMQLDGMEFKER